MKSFLQSIVILLTAAVLGLGLSSALGKYRDSQYQTKEKEDVYEVEDLKKFFYEEKITHNDLRKKEKINILLIPGHTNEHPGSEYLDIREFDLNNLVAQEIEKQFSYKEYKNIKVINAFDNKDLQEFLSDEKTIQDFRLGYQRLANYFRNDPKDSLEQEKGEELDISHSNTPPEIIQMLYGINQWIGKSEGENEIDIVIHVHFNNYFDKERDKNKKGEYEGFAIYIPDQKFSNYSTSKVLAESVHSKLSLSLGTSTLPSEEEGIIENKELIALGAFNTLKVPVILIEYGFIYEDQFSDLNKGSEILEEISQKTKEGIIGFLK